MGSYFSPTTGMHYSSREQMERMEKAYLADIEKQQVNEMKRANEIAEKNAQYRQQELQAERENAKQIAEATIQAEEIRAYNQERSDLIRQRHKLELEEMKQERQKNMRYNRLCDELGVNYQDLKDFDEFLRYSKESSKSLEIFEYQIKQKKEKLEEYEDENYIYNFEEDIDDEEDDDIKYLNIAEIEDEIDEENEKIKEMSNIKISLTQIIIDLPLLCWVGYQALAFFTCGADFNLFILSLAVFIIFNLICRLDIKMRVKNATDECNKKINKYKKEITRKKNLAKKTQKTQIKKLNDEITELELSIQRREDENHKAMEIIYNKFIEFRLTHYNEDIENLFRKLNLVNIIQKDNEFERDNKLISELKTGNGTIADYTNFIRKIIVQNS